MKISIISKKIDTAFNSFQKSFIGKFLIEKVFLRKKSFYSILSSFGLILVMQLSAYNNAIQWADEIDTQLENAEGWSYLAWLSLSFIAPEGNLMIIIVLFIIILIAFIIRYMELSQAKSIEKTLRKLLQEKTKNILFQIKTSILYNDKKIELDRTNEINDIKEKITSKQVIVLSGEGGIGKTAVIKQIFKESNEKNIFYVIKAIELQDKNVLYEHKINDFIETHNKFNSKMLVIDSAEKLMDITNTEFFKEFLSALIRDNWKIIFTTRHSYLDDLNYEFIENYQIKPYSIEIKKLSINKLNDLSSKFKFKIPNEEKLKKLILNPFYLNEFLQTYDKTKEYNYLDFKNKLWNKSIKKSDLNRENCFLKLAFERATSGYFFLKSDCQGNSLKKLLQDGILGHDTAGYFIAHDIYEEWALERIIESEFINKANEYSFFEKIGSSLPIRRSFRNWVSEKLLYDEDIKLFIENIMDNSQVEQFWKDEILISVLLSDYSDTFFKIFDKELFKNNAKLLQRISFLLRIACKEIDNNILEFDNLNINTLEVFSIFNKPKGLGWESFINIVYKHKEKLGLQHIEFISPVLEEWQAKNQKGNTSKNASLIALNYYDLINQEEYSYSDSEYVGKICNVIILGSFEVQEELKAIFEKIIINKWKNSGDNYYKLSKMILSTKYGLPRASLILKYFPYYAFKLANLFWTYTPKKVSGEWLGGYQSDAVETNFGIGEYSLEHFPSSALRTPVYYLLKFHAKTTIDFIIDFMNECVEKYVKSDYEEINEVEVYIDNKTVVVQYHSQALWNIYRGISSPKIPYLLQSLHMALEKYILEVAEDSSQENIEILLKSLLSKSKSSSISAIVTSAVLAYPDKTFNIAVVLFKIKDFIRADFIRQFSDISETRFLYGMGYDLNTSNKAYSDERLKTCEDKHRQWHLESLFLNYQVFRSNNVSEKESQRRQKILWDILDGYYEKLSLLNEQTESEKRWNIALSRMDKRKMNMKVKKVKKGFELTFDSKMEPQLKEYSESSQKQHLEVSKYVSLFLWSKNRLENNQDYKKYKEFENTPLLALQQLKELNTTNLEEQNLILRKETLPDTSIVLLRDFPSNLKLEDKKLCKDIILEFAILPFRQNYNYQVSDGTDSAIANLPLILPYFPDLKSDTKLILLLSLFRNYEIGMSGRNVNDNAIEAIINYYEKDIESFILGYLLLKPKYDSMYWELRKKNENMAIDKFIQDFEDDIEKFRINNLKIDDIDLNIDVINLSVILKFIKFKQVKPNIIFQKISKIFILKVFKPKKGKEKHKDIDFMVKQKLFSSFPYIIYKLDNNDIQIYMQPLLDNFQATEDITYLLLAFIRLQDDLNQYDKFWYVWELFEDKIIALCKDGEYGYTNQVIKTYLLAWGPYGAIWKDKSKDWHSLKEKDKRFFKLISTKIAHCPSTLYSISKLLTGIGSSYLIDGIGWISIMLKNNKNLWSTKLEPSTILNIEILSRKYVIDNSGKIKKDRIKKEEVLEVLNFLVEKGSAIGYKLREKIL